MCRLGDEDLNGCSWLRSGLKVGGTVGLNPIKNELACFEASSANRLLLPIEEDLLILMGESSSLLACSRTTLIVEAFFLMPMIEFDAC